MAQEPCKPRLGGRARSPRDRSPMRSSRDLFLIITRFLSITQLALQLPAHVDDLAGREPSSRLAHHSWTAPSGGVSVSQGVLPVTRGMRCQRTVSNLPELSGLLTDRPGLRGTVF
jgi:hypothetical protein